MLNLVVHIVTTRPQNVSHRAVRCYIFRCTVVKIHSTQRDRKLLRKSVRNREGCLSVHGRELYTTCQYCHDAHLLNVTELLRCYCDAYVQLPLCAEPDTCLISRAYLQRPCFRQVQANKMKLKYSAIRLGIMYSVMLIISSYGT